MRAPRSSSGARSSATTRRAGGARRGREEAPGQGDGSVDAGVDGQRQARRALAHARRAGQARHAGGGDGAGRRSARARRQARAGRGRRARRTWPSASARSPRASATLASREATLAKRERDTCGAVAMPAKIDLPKGLHYTAKDVEPTYKKALKLMQEKGLLTSDLPPGTSKLVEDTREAMKKADFVRAKYDADQLLATVEEIKIDRSFISAKMARLSAAMRGKKLEGGDKQDRRGPVSGGHRQLRRRQVPAGERQDQPPVRALEGRLRVRSNFSRVSPITGGREEIHARTGTTRRSGADSGGRARLSGLPASGRRARRSWDRLTCS